MRTAIAALVAVLLGVGPTTAAAQRAATTVEEVMALKSMAAVIPLGSRVKVQIRDGRRLTATLMSVSDDAIVVKRESRIPEPAMSIRFDELARLQRNERNGGFTIGKAIGVGLAAGVGAILTMFGIMVAVGD